MANCASIWNISRLKSWPCSRQLSLRVDGPKPMSKGPIMLSDKRILLIIGGGIAAYKSLSLIRLLRGAGAVVTPVLTRAGTEFVTPLSVAALAGEKVYTDLFDLTDESQMGHIQLSRVADLIVVAPATADLMAKMAGGRADDLASTLLLATDTPVLMAPAMNVRMWNHPATQRNLAQLRAASPLQRLTMPQRLADPETLQATWADFQPAIPTTSDGALTAGLGYVSGWSLTALLWRVLAWPFRRRRYA